jgi:hypothetical protein
MSSFRDDDSKIWVSLKKEISLKTLAMLFLLRFRSFFCCVNDYIKYGPIIGFALFAGKFFSQGYNSWVVEFIRVLAILLLGLVVSLRAIKKRNQAYFPFKVIWLSGFNIVIVSSLVSSALLVLMRDLFFAEPQPLEVGLFIGFHEFIFTEFFGIIVVSIISFTLKKY